MLPQVFSIICYQYNLMVHLYRQKKSLGLLLKWRSLSFNLFQKSNLLGNHFWLFYTEAWIKGNRSELSEPLGAHSLYFLQKD